MNTRRKITTAAMAFGVLAGSAGVANAAMSSSTPPVTSSVQSTQVKEAPDANEAPGAVDNDTIENGSQNEVDGVNDSNEAPDVNEAPGVAETDGVDHQFQGEEIGNNGDGIPGPADAAEVPGSVVG